jgi:hypothetical protein
VEFRILGPLEVEDGGRVLSLGGAKQRALLALLVLHANEVVSRDRLIDELWAERAPGTAATAVQVYVSNLRKVLGRDVIVTQAPGYLVRVHDDELDLARFEQLVAQARAEAPAEAAQTLRRALSLWRGSPLADLDASFQQARERGADHARRVDHHRVERDRVRQVGAVADEVDVGRLSQHDVDGLHDRQEQRERDQVDDRHDAQRRDDGERRGLQHQERLRDEQRATPIHAIDQHADEGAERQHADVGAEGDDAEQHGRLGEPPGEPAHRDLLRPGADQRQALAG